MYKNKLPLILQPKKPGFDKKDKQVI